MATNWIGITLRRDSSDITASVGVASGSKRRISSVAFNQSDENLISIPFSFLDSPSAGTHEYHLQITIDICILQSYRVDQFVRPIM